MSNENINFKLIKPKYNFSMIIGVAILKQLPFLLILSIFTLIQGNIGGTLLVAIIMIFITIPISVIPIYMSIKNTEYKFYDDRVEYYEGFMVQNRKTITYDKITNINQVKGIIDRTFNLGTINIDTAGYSKAGHELSLKYIADADKVYDWIVKKTSKQ